MSAHPTTGPVGPATVGASGGPATDASTRRDRGGRSSRAPSAPRRRRRWVSVAGDTALTVAAAVGATCILLVLATLLFDVRVTLFSTGSMSPTIPAGAAAVARGIPASEISVGDVVTVERPGQLPITHRVRSVEPVEGEPELRRITMRGDANAVDDPFPYDVERVRVVVFSVPGIAPVIAAAGTPPVLATVTVVATLLVVAMFWPRRRPARGAPVDASGDAVATSPDAETRP